MTDKNAEHAISNAKAWLSSIMEDMAEYERLDAGDDYNATDEKREEIEQGPLSVQVRGGWHSPGDRDGFNAKPEEFEILLSTGGPALRIIGDLDGYGQPSGPRLQYQDWFLPWTDYDIDSEEEEVLEAYCRLFWFGD